MIPELEAREARSAGESAAIARSPACSSTGSLPPASGASTCADCSSRPPIPYRVELICTLLSGTPGTCRARRAASRSWTTRLPTWRPGFGPAVPWLRSQPETLRTVHAGRRPC